MNAINIILLVYCGILTIVVIAYIVSHEKSNFQKINELGRDKIPIMYGSKIHYVFGDSTPDEVIKIMGEPNSVSINPLGNGFIEYVHDTSAIKVIKGTNVKFIFSKFNLIEIK